MACIRKCKGEAKYNRIPPAYALHSMSYALFQFKGWHWICMHVVKSVGMICDNAGTVQVSLPQLGQ